MAAKPPVVLILGAGPNIGQAVARTFASKGYKVALAARSLHEADSTDDQLSIPSDFSKTGDVVNAFAKAKKGFGIVYNGKTSPSTAPSRADRDVTVSAGNFTPADDPFALPFVDFNRDTTINIHSAFVAAQQAVSGFAQLPASAARTLIYTGNVLNVAILPKFLAAGVGKSGAAHMIWVASAAYRDRGYK